MQSLGDLLSSILIDFLGSYGEFSNKLGLIL